jgi:hypothetical protein
VTPAQENRQVSVALRRIQEDYGIRLANLEERVNVLDGKSAQIEPGEQAKKEINRISRELDKLLAPKKRIREIE